MKTKRKRSVSTLCRVVAVDDDEAICQTLKELIEAVEGFYCVASFTDPGHAMKEIPKLAPDLVLVDVRMQRTSGVQCARLLKAQAAEIKVLMVSGSASSFWVEKAAEAGVDGYLVKPLEIETLASGMKACMDGGVAVSDVVQPAWQGRRALPAPPDMPTGERGAEKLSRLTPRQREILELLTEGLLYKEMCEELRISQKTLHNHLTMIYHELGVSNRVEAVRLITRGR